MRTKFSLIFTLLVAMFLIVVGGIIYDSVYAPAMRAKDEVAIVVIRETINKGDLLTKAHVKTLVIPKSMMNKQYVTRKEFDQLMAARRISNSLLLPNEILTKARMVNLEKNLDIYEVLVQSSNPVQVKKGDTVSVYVQLEIPDSKQKRGLTYVTGKIALRKTVQEVQAKQTSDGASIPETVEALKLYLSEEEATAYFVARGMGDAASIVVVKNRNLPGDENGQIPLFTKMTEYQSSTWNPNVILHGKANIRIR